MKPFEQGILAFYEWIDINCCPYEVGTPENVEWSDGWRSAEQEDFMLYYG